MPTKMKAVLIKDGKGPVENLYIGEEGTPEPEEGQVQVQVSLDEARTHGGSIGGVRYQLT